MSERPVHQIERYTRWLAGRHGLQFDATTIEGYDALWRWSTGSSPSSPTSTSTRNSAPAS